MIDAERLPNGHILAPATFTTEDDTQEVTGEGQVELAPGDPAYDTWDEWLSTS